MSVFSKFQEAAKGTPLEQVAKDYEKATQKADNVLREKQAKDWEEFQKRQR